MLFYGVVRGLAKYRLLVVILFIVVFTKKSIHCSIGVVLGGQNPDYFFLFFLFFLSFFILWYFMLFFLMFPYVLLVFVSFGHDLLVFVSFCYFSLFFFLNLFNFIENY